MAFTIIIPARYASGRLPGKPLLDIAGKPMISHVIACAKQSDADEVIVATDDERIARVASNDGITAYLTDESHNSGTERIAEVIDKHGISENTIIINLQGDEPLTPFQCLNQLGHALEHDPDAEMATLSTPITDINELFDWHIAKLVCDNDGHALYFSRAPIPWDREGFMQDEKNMSGDGIFHRHIGLYAYRAGFVKEYNTWESCTLEKIESLEQLRVLYHGRKIKVITAEQLPGPGVNTLDELKRVEKILTNTKN